jgi:hypothetical protein
VLLFSIQIESAQVFLYYIFIFALLSLHQSNILILHLISWHWIDLVRWWYWSNCWPSVIKLSFHKNSKDLLDNLKSRSFSQVSSIKTFDKLQTCLKETIPKASSHRNYGSKLVVLGYNSTYFSNKIQKGTTCYSEEQVISMLELLIDSIFVSFGGHCFSRSSAYQWVRIASLL